MFLFSGLVWDFADWWSFNLTSTRTCCAIGRTAWRFAMQVSWCFVNSNRSMCNNSNTRQGLSLTLKSSMNFIKFGCGFRLMCFEAFTCRKRHENTLPPTWMTKWWGISDIHKSLKVYLISGQFKIIWIFEELYCNFLFCFLSLTLGNITIVTGTNDFQYFICMSSTAQNIVFFYWVVKMEKKCERHINDGMQVIEHTSYFPADFRQATFNWYMK